MDVFSRFRTFRSKLCAAGIAATCFGAGLFLVEGGAMNLKEQFLVPAIRAIGKAVGVTEFARTFMRGDDVVEGRGTLRSAYSKSVWVMSAIETLVQPIKAVSLKFYVGDDEFEDPKLSTFWRSPAKGFAGKSYIDASAGAYNLHGEFFWILDDSWLVRSARVRSPFIVASPRKMREIVQGGELLGWVWTDDGGRQIRLLSEQVIHQKRWDPENPWRGLSKLEAALMAAESDHAAARFARDTFMNAGTAGDYVIAKGGVPTDGQRDQIIEQLREKRAALKRGDYRPVFLTGDIDVKNPQVTAPDAAFVANRVANRHEIYAAFGVPMSMADVVASYSIGSASDLFRLIHGTCIPMSVTIQAAIDQLIKIQTGRSDIESYFDWDEHPVMQAVRAERVDSAQKLWQMGMPIRLASDYLDMGLPKFVGDTISYLPFSVAPANAESDPTDSAPLSTNEPTSEDPAIAAMLKVLSAPATKAQAKSERDSRRVALAQQHEATRRVVEKQFIAKFKKCSMPARSEVLRKIEAAKSKSISSKAVASDFNFELPKFRTALTVEMRKQSKAALIEAGQQMFEELGKDDVFAMAPHAAFQFLTARENRIKDAAEEVHNQITSTLQQGLDAGDTMDELAERVRTAFSGIDKGRASTIATTETAAAYGVARHDAMEQSGIQYKQWLTAGDDHVRDSHITCEGEIVALHENFSNGLAFPGDPNGPPEEVINCRCVQIASAGPDGSKEA